MTEHNGTSKTDSELVMERGKISLDQLRQWRDCRSAAEIAIGATTWHGKPKYWFDDPHWFCVNGHVSDRYRKMNDVEMCICCENQVILGPCITESDFRHEILRAIRG